MGKLQNFLLAGLTALLAVVGAELLLSWLLPFPDPYAGAKIDNDFIPSAHQPNTTLQIEIEEGLPGLSGTNSFTTNNVGLRGEPLSQPKPDGEVRIFLIGGSTAECLGISDGESIDRVLQVALQDHAPAGLSVRVYNAGKSGDRSPDHVAMLTQRILHLEPDVVVVVAGINDLLGAMHGYDYLHPAGRTFSLWRSLPLLATEFQIPRRLHALARRMRPGERAVLEEVGWKTTYREKAALQRSKPVTDALPTTDLGHFDTNMTTIAGLAEAHDFDLVLMTQASTWSSSVDPEARDWHWMRYRNDFVYGEEVMDEALEQYNDVTRRIAADRRLMLYDLAAEAPKSLDLFIDDVHFNVAGAAYAADGLARSLLDRDIWHTADTAANPAAIIPEGR